MCYIINTIHSYPREKYVRVLLVSQTKPNFPRGSAGKADWMPMNSSVKSFPVQPESWTVINACGVCIEIGTVFPIGLMVRDPPERGRHWDRASLTMEGSNEDDRKPRTEMWLAAVRCSSIVHRRATVNNRTYRALFHYLLIFRSSSARRRVSVSRGL